MLSPLVCLTVRVVAAKEELEGPSPPRLTCVNLFWGLATHLVVYFLVVCRNYNYNWVGQGMQLDLLHHPDYLQRNGTLAFASALYHWMTPRYGRPSPHSVMVGEWTPSFDDTLANRLPGFGLTINILHHLFCGTSRVEPAQIIGHYERFLGELHGVSPGDNKDCNLQGQWLTDSDHSTA